MAIELKKSIFFHIPKSGGTWVTRVLEKIPGAKQLRGEGEHYLNLRGEHVTPRAVDTGRKIRFGFVRKPEAWLWSLWSYRMDNNWDMNFVLDRKCKALDFNKFVENVLREYPEGFVSMMYQEYIGENMEFMDMIGVQENLREDLIRILQDCEERFDRGIIMNKKRVNVSSSSGKPMPLRKDLLEKVRDAESWTYDNFYKEVKCGGKTKSA